MKLTNAYVLLAISTLAQLFSISAQASLDAKSPHVKCYLDRGPFVYKLYDERSKDKRREVVISVEEAIRNPNCGRLHDYQLPIRAYARESQQSPSSDLFVVAVKSVKNTVNRSVVVTGTPATYDCLNIGEQMDVVSNNKALRARVAAILVDGKSRGRYCSGNTIRKEFALELQDISAEQISNVHTLLKVAE